MPTTTYLIGESFIYGKDGLQTNQGFLKIKANLTLKSKGFILQKYATYTACNPNTETIVVLQIHNFGYIKVWGIICLDTYKNLF